MFKICGKTFYNLFDAYLCVHYSFTIVLLAAHVLYIVFAPGALKNTITTVCVLVGVYVFRCVMMGVYLIISKFPVNVKFLLIFRTVSQITTGLLGVVPRVTVFFDPLDYSNFSTVVFCYLLLPLAFNKHASFLHQWIINYSNKSKLIFFICCVHLILLITSIRLATAFSSGWDTVAIIVAQVTFAPMCIVASIDTVMILLKKYRWKNAPAPQVDNGGNAAPVNVLIEPEAGENVEKEETSCANCCICYLEYSSDKLPRILKECGHTVCSQCAAELLTKNHNHYLFCPICQMVTVVEGDVSRIPMNHALMTILDELKARQ